MTLPTPTPADVEAWRSRRLPNGRRIPADCEACEACGGRHAGHGDHGYEECTRCLDGTQHIRIAVRMPCDCEGVWRDCPDCDGAGSVETSDLGFDEIRDRELGTPAQQREAALICAALDAEDESAPAEPCAAE